MFDYSGQLLKWAKRFIPGGCSTESKKPQTLFASEKAPSFFKKAEGSRLIDVDGIEYVDFGMALGSCILGYNHPVVVEAIQRELKNGILSALSSPLEPKLAELIVETFPSIEMVRFLKTGAEACSAAVRLARAYTQREPILACGYFGWHDWTNKGAGVPKSAKSLCLEFAFNNSADFFKKLRELPGLPAAVIMEPVVAEPPDQEFLRTIRDYCQKSGIVLIWDEIKTGARMAPGGAQQHYGFTPDLTVLGKGIASGMPLAAVGGKKEIMEAWDLVWISSTYASESLSLAAAIATLSFIRENPVNIHIERLGTKLLYGFKNITHRFPFACKYSGIPQMNTIGLKEAVQDLQKLEADFFQEILKSGFIIKRHGYNFVSHAHSEQEVENCLDAIYKAFEKITQKA